ncbi:cytochrome P450 [Chitinophaga sp.]|uniref:cytochrome P450 n=1 Tax=Chitinophaga sp. TaxID=1869181 RepID=UPI002F924292
MSTSLSELTIWHRNLLGEPVYDKEFMSYFGASGAWQISRHKDVEAVLSDHQTFSSEYMPKQDDNIFTRNLNLADPPRHKLLRSLATKAFSPAIIAQSESWITQQCEELLAPWLAGGEIDFVNDFALLIPHRVISKILGVPDHDHEQVRVWITAVAGDPREIGMEIFGRSMQEMSVFFGELIKERTARPQADLISHLITAEADGQRLEHLDIIAMCVAIFLGGYETTKSSLANALFVFTEFPEIQQHLAANPGDIPKAVTEALRLLSPVRGFPRIATRDVELSGQQIKKGDLVNTWISTANRDHDVFPAPDVFDLNRPNLTQVMNFGHGIHYCLGAPLARVETRIAFTVLFSKVKNIRVKDKSQLQLDKSSLVYSLKGLPVLFDTVKP